MNDIEFRDHVVRTLSRIEQRQVDERRRLRMVEQDIMGNGDPGLKERVAVLEERSPRRIAAGVSGGVTGAIVSAIVAAVSIILGGKPLS